MTQNKISLGLKKSEFESLAAEAVKAGLRKPGENGTRGIAPILRKKLAVAFATSPQTVQPVSEELPPAIVPPRMKRVRIWYTVSSCNALRYEGRLLCIDETFVTAQIEDEIKLFHKDSILGPIMVAEDEVG